MERHATLIGECLHHLLEGCFCSILPVRHPTRSDVYGNGLLLVILHRTLPRSMHQRDTITALCCAIKRYAKLGWTRNHNLYLFKMMCIPYSPGENPPPWQRLILFPAFPFALYAFQLPTFPTKKYLSSTFFFRKSPNPPSYIRNLPQIWSRTTTPTNDSDATKTVVGPTCSPGLSSV